MSVYVDPLFATAPKQNWPYSQACHMFADTEEELHTFARRLFGVYYRHSWFQQHHADPFFWHYDITKNMRSKACKLGAVEITWEAWMERVQQHREEMKQGMVSHDAVPIVVDAKRA